MGKGYVYLIMWICVFNETDTRFCLCQDTGTMNRPLRLAECSHPISWVFATLLQTVSSIIADRSQPFHGIFVTH